MSNKKQSEFGKGCSYCLGLFLAHEWKYSDFAKSSIRKDIAVECFFNAASDHLYELEIPSKASPSLKKRLLLFQKKCLTWGHGFRKPSPTEKDFLWATQEAKDLLRIIDEQLLHVKTIKGDWQ